LSVGRKKLPTGSEVIGGGVINSMVQGGLGALYRSPAFQHALLSAEYFIVSGYYCIANAMCPCLEPKKSSLLRVLERHATNPTQNANEMSEAQRLALLRAFASASSHLGFVVVPLCSMIVIVVWAVLLDLFVPDR